MGSGNKLCVLLVFDFHVGGFVAEVLVGGVKSVLLDLLFGMILVGRKKPRGQLNQRPSGAVGICHGHA